MSYVYVDGADPRHSTLQKGFNLRWPPTAEAGAAAIYVCRTADDVIAAARDALAPRRCARAGQPVRQCL